MEVQEERKNSRNQKEMSFLDHLEELRKRILVSLLFIVIASILGYVLGKKALLLLSMPVAKLYFFSPTEAFLVRLKVAGVIGVFISIPFLLYELWLFIKPGLYEKERRYAFPLIFSGTILFYAGAFFALLVGLPIGIRVLMSFGGDALVGLINANRYINFALILVLSFAFLFQLPIVIIFLVKLGVLDPNTLKRRRKEVILGIFLVVAIITPSVDMVSLLLLAVPLVILFEVSIWASILFVRKNPEPELVVSSEIDSGEKAEEENPEN